MLSPTMKVSKKARSHSRTQESDENTQGGQALLSVDDVYVVSVGLLDKDD